MDTRLLRSFVTTVRTGSISAAATELAYVQSTVTAHVQALERLTGTCLLDRLAGGVRPTAAGTQLAEHAGQILELEERMLTELNPANQRPRGQVRLAAPESICAYRLPPVLRTVSERLPDVRLWLVPATTPAALTALRERNAELALVLEPNVAGPDVRAVDLGPQPLALVAAPTTTFPREEVLSAPELAESAVLLLEQGCSYSDELAKLLAAADPTYTPSRFGSVETVKRCVEADLGIALLPAITVEAELAAGTLTQLRSPLADQQHLWVLNPTNRWTSPAVSAVMELLRTELSSDRPPSAQ